MTNTSWAVMSALLFAFTAAECGAGVVTFGGVDFHCFNSSIPSACTNGGIPSGTAADIWNTGDYWDQTFTGTGLTSINQLTLSLSLFDNLANLQPELISITVNGLFVGSFGETGDGTIQNPLRFSQTYNTVAAIPGIGSGGTAYDITFTLDPPGVPGANGTLGLITGNGQSTAILSTVPEPATAASMILALFGISIVIHRRRSIFSPL